MMQHTWQAIRTQLERTPATARMMRVLLRTPTHAVHWYALLATALVIVLVGVIFAWVVFAGIPGQVRASLFTGTQPETIQRAELTEAIDAFRARDVLFERLRQVRPEIRDPS